MWWRSVTLLTLIAAVGGFAAYRWAPLPIDPNEVDHADEPGFTVHRQPSVALDAMPEDLGPTLLAELDAKAWDRLDAQAAAYRHPEALYVGGVSKLFEFYLTLFRDPFEAGAKDRSPRALEAAAREWARARPASHTAQIALAEIYLGEAWETRGSGYADDVDDAAWATVGDTLTGAESALLDVPLDEDPEASRILLEVGALRGQGVDRLLPIYEAAHRRFPEYHELVSTMANLLQPRWFGNREMLAAFVRGFADPSRGVDGQLDYSEAAAELIRSNRMEPAFFAETGLDFRKVVAAFQVREQTYGLPNRYWNALFALSMAGLDCESGHVALEEMHGQRAKWIFSPERFKWAVDDFHATTRFKT